MREPTLFPSLPLAPVASPDANADTARTIVASIVGTDAAQCADQRRAARAERRAARQQRHVAAMLRDNAADAVDDGRNAYPTESLRRFAAARAAERAQRAADVATVASLRGTVGEGETIATARARHWRTVVVPALTAADGRALEALRRCAERVHGDPADVAAALALLWSRAAGKVPMGRFRGTLSPIRAVLTAARRAGELAERQRQALLPLGDAERAAVLADRAATAAHHDRKRAADAADAAAARLAKVVTDPAQRAELLRAVESSDALPVRVRVAIHRIRAKEGARRLADVAAD